MSWIIPIEDKKQLFSCYSLLFFLVITSNIVMGAFLLSDALYGLIATFLFLKNKKNVKSYLIFSYIIYYVLASILNYNYYANERGLQSSLRFIYNFFLCIIFIACLDQKEMRKKIIDGYLNACLFFSFFIFLQIFLYYVLKINLNLDFGDLASQQNMASEYDPLSDLMYRTGGLFKEPSFFAAFVSPSIFILYRYRYFKKLFYVLLGIIFSTSGLGFAVILIFSSYIIVNANTKFKILFVIFCFLIFVSIPFVFQHVMLGGSTEIRLVEPFVALIEEGDIGLLGGNPAMHYFGDEILLWINTFVFILLYFGFLGILLFIKFIYYTNAIYLTITILCLIIIEGLYGRIDFWMVVFVSYLFNQEIGMSIEKSSLNKGGV